MTIKEFQALVERIDASDQDRLPAGLLEMIAAAGQIVEAVRDLLFMGRTDFPPEEILRRCGRLVRACMTVGVRMRADVAGYYEMMAGRLSEDRREEHQKMSVAALAVKISDMAHEPYHLLTDSSDILDYFGNAQERNCAGLLVEILLTVRDFLELRCNGMSLEDAIEMNVSE